MKDAIQLIYVEDGKTYYGVISRSFFLYQMKHMVNWFPVCNDNAIKLCELIPNIDCITINKDIIDTQDVPFILYRNVEENTENCLRFCRSYRIIWSFFLHFCEEAKQNSK